MREKYIPPRNTSFLHSGKAQRAVEGAGLFDLEMAKKTRKNVSGHKLTDKAQSFLLQALAEYWKPENIFEQLRQRHKVATFTHQSLKYYRDHPKYAEEIAARRKKYLEDFDSIDLAQKKVRVQKLADKYDALEKKSGGVVTEEVVGRQQSILEQIRREMEQIESKKGSAEDPIVLKIISHIPGLGNA